MNGHIVIVGAGHAAAQTSEVVVEAFDGAVTQRDRLKERRAVGERAR